MSNWPRRIIISKKQSSTVHSSNSGTIEKLLNIAYLILIAFALLQSNVLLISILELLIQCLALQVCICAFVSIFFLSHFPATIHCLIENYQIYVHEWACIYACVVSWFRGVYGIYLRVYMAVCYAYILYLFGTHWGCARRNSYNMCRYIFYRKHVFCVIVIPNYTAHIDAYINTYHIQCDTEDNARQLPQYVQPSTIISPPNGSEKAPDG